MEALLLLRALREFRDKNFLNLSGAQTCLTLTRKGSRIAISRNPWGLGPEEMFDMLLIWLGKELCNAGRSQICRTGRSVVLGDTRV